MMFYFLARLLLKVQGLCLAVLEENLENEEMMRGKREGSGLWPNCEDVKMCSQYWLYKHLALFLLSQLMVLILDLGDRKLKLIPIMA